MCGFAVLEILSYVFSYLTELLWGKEISRTYSLRKPPKKGDAEGDKMGELTVKIVWTMVKIDDPNASISKDTLRTPRGFNLLFPCLLPPFQSFFRPFQSKIFV